MSSLPFHAAAAAEAFYRDFPERRADCFFLDTERFGWLKAALDDHEPWIGGKRFDYGIVEDRFRENEPQAFPVHCYWPGYYSPLNFFMIGDMSRSFRDTLLSLNWLRRDVAYREAVMPPIGRPMADPGREDDWRRFVFDHEAAHVLAATGKLALWRKDREQNRHLDECIADCYALLRHRERHGGDTEFVREVINWRLLLLPHMHNGRMRAPRDAHRAYHHMTGFCIGALQDVGGIAASAKDCFRLAVAHVERTALSGERLDSLERAAHLSLPALDKGWEAFTAAWITAADPDAAELYRNAVQALVVPGMTPQL